MQLTPNVQALIRAKVIGKTVFDVIERTPAVNDVDASYDTYELKH